MHETVKRFVACQPDSWPEREFAYSCIRSFLRVADLPPHRSDYQVGGSEIVVAEVNG